MICRRTFLSNLAFGVLLASRSSKAQQKRIFRVGLLIPGPGGGPFKWMFVDPLRDLGYTEGKNLIVEFPDVAPQDLPSAARELVRMKVDVIWAGASSSVRAAANATKEIPIVAVDLESDPVASGYASSLARPGGNVTGFFLDLPGFSAKRLEVLKDALPNVSGVTVLWDPTLDRAPLSGVDAAARTLKLRLVVTEVHAAPDLDNAFRAASHRKDQAVMVMQSPTLDAYEDKILKLGAKYRLPVFAVFAPVATNGALLSYGPSVQDMIARSAMYVHRVLQGAKAGDLPIQRPTKFDLVVNARTAKSLGLTIGQSILLRADEVVW